jgi:hypothetical protein
MEHPNWNVTISDIIRLGGKAGTGENSRTRISNLSDSNSDWVKDKERSKFAFQALCWEKSFIPELVWRAGEANTNLIESVHANVNREGVQCSLVGGIKKGQAFDALKMKTIEVELPICSRLRLLIQSHAGAQECWNPAII